MIGPAPFINRKLVELARRDDTLIVFPHAQRTGGKAFRDQVLAAAYGKDCIYSVSRGTGSKLWRDVTAEDLKGFRVYTGASNFADLDKGRPCVFLALVRHPLYRVVSLYGYCRKRADHRLYELATKLPLEDFYREASQVYPIYLRNTQCLRICGKPSAHKARRTLEEKYLGAGLSSDIGGFAKALGEALGWPPIQVDSIAPDEERYADLITPGFRDIVLRESAEDLKLYEALATGPRPGPSRSLLTRIRNRFSARPPAPVAPDAIRPSTRSGPTKPASPDGRAESIGEFSMPASPFDKQDEAFFEHKKQNPETTFAQFFMKQEADRVRRGGHHHSLGENIDGRGVQNDFWQAGAYKAAKYIRASALKPSSKVIEYGCGSLRIAGHFIRFLEPGNFLGLDVVGDFYEIGKGLIGPDLLREKAPRFAVIGEDSVAEAENFLADFVYCSGVCVHVHPHEIETYFRTLARLCRKPGSRLRFDATIAEKPLRYRHRSWAWPLGFLKRSLEELEFVQVSYGNERLEGDEKIVLATLEFRRGQG